MPKIIRYPFPMNVQDSMLNGVLPAADTKPFQTPDCPICMEPVEAATRTKPCRHTFHFDCIQSWIYAQAGSLKHCLCCRKRMMALQKIASHGCCISTQSVSRMRRPLAPPRSQSPEEAAADAVAEQQIRAHIQELEIFEQARLAAEAAQLQAFERFERERRAADQQARTQRLEWEYSRSVPIVLCTILQNLEANIILGTFKSLPSTRVCDLTDTKSNSEQAGHVISLSEQRY
ncbi:hypothetical protein N431DRAFT_442220 [Stipitochalara longipes BDJ]|nr:hypothetical protein N431DRAFT_442220 [Stipitochalara longipes BDJ]